SAIQGDERPVQTMEQLLELWQRLPRDAGIQHHRRVVLRWVVPRERLQRQAIADGKVARVKETMLFSHEPSSRNEALAIVAQRHHISAGLIEAAPKDPREPLSF